LTALGIVIGIAAVIIGVALGNGVQDFFDKAVGPLTTQITVTATTGNTAGRPARDLTDGDAIALTNATRAPSIRAVVPVITGTAVLHGGSRQRRVHVIGTSADYFSVTNRQPLAGRFFPATSTGLRGKPPIVLGAVPAAELFGDVGAAAVGQTVRLGRASLMVVGVLATNSQQDDVAVVPLLVARSSLFGNNGTINQIIVQCIDAGRVSEATEEINEILDARHRVNDPSARDFDTLSLQSLIEQRAQFLAVLRTFIGAIAAISLLVGGIGIANIMLVAVTERTREIGLRKAVGATNRAIMEQFLIEAGTLAGVGGLVGIAVGVGACWAADAVLPRAITSFPAPVVSPASVLISFAIAVVVGLLAGGYPAHRAARMRIVDALRFE
jgi:putative ABC transport system permease protein